VGPRDDEPFEQRRDKDAVKRMVFHVKGNFYLELYYHGNVNMTRLAVPAERERREG